MRKRDTTGEYVISNVEARLAARGDEPSMDSDAFGGFYQRSAPGLRAYLARVSGNPALADDLMQESYVRFLCAAHPEGGEVNYRRYDNLPNSLGYVHRVACSHDPTWSR